MTTQTVDDVPWGGRVIETIWVGHTTNRDGSIPLVDVEMAVHDQVDRILVENTLKCGLAWCATVARGIVRTVTEDNDPRSDRTVDSGKICSQPSKLLTARSKWTSRVIRIRGVRDVSLSVNGDKVHHAVIIRIPHVADSRVV